MAKKSTVPKKETAKKATTKKATTKKATTKKETTKKATTKKETTKKSTTKKETTKKATGKSNGYLSFDDIETQLADYQNRSDRLVSLDVLNQLRAKLKERASEINATKSKPDKNSTYVTQEQFETIMLEIFRSYTFAEMDPGAAAGVVSAQSIGEPGTQMSISGNERIIVQFKDKIQVLTFEELVNDLIDLLPESKKIQENDSFIGDVTELNLQVPSLVQTEKVEWLPVAEISRHKPNGNLIKVDFASGRSIIATPSHSFVVRAKNSIIPIKGNMLKIGDSIPVMMKFPKHSPQQISSELTYGNSGNVQVALRELERKVKASIDTTDISVEILTIVRNLEENSDYKIPVDILEHDENFRAEFLEHLLYSELTSLEGMDYRINVHSDWNLQMIGLLFSMFEVITRFNKNNYSLIVNENDFQYVLGLNSIKSTKTDVIPGFENLNEIVNIKLKTSFQNFSSLQRTELIQIYNSLKNHKNSAELTEELLILENAIYSDVTWDRITNIKRIKSPTTYVYDFSVPGSETFVTADGVVTHNTLRTFHFAGVREMNVTLGLPRLIEIVDARKKPSTPSMTVALEPEYETNREKAKEVAQNIELTTVNDLAEKLETDQINLTINVSLNKELLSDKGVTPEEVREKIQKRKYKASVDGNVIVVYPNAESPTLQELQKLSEKVRAIPIKGLKGVSRVMIKKKSSKEGEEERFEIISEGSNFIQVLRIPGVDPEKSYTNHIHEIAETLGIEAARNAIIRESNEVMEKQGLEVDMRHLMLVSDLMTYSGDIRQIGRHGISGENTSVLARAAFEVTVKHLLDASIRGERDNLVGIIENVIVGQEITLGTGIVDLTISPNYKEFVTEKSK